MVMTARLLFFVSIVCLCGCLIAPAADGDSVTLEFGIPFPSIIDTQAGSERVPNGPWGYLNLTLNPNGSIAADLTMKPGFLVDWLSFNPSGGITGVSVTGLPPNWTFTLSPAPDESGIEGFGSYVAVVEGGLDSSLVPNLTLVISRDGGFSSVYQIIQTSNGEPQPSGSPIALLVSNAPAACPACSDWAAGVGNTPEPSSFFLFGTGLLALFLLRRRHMCSDNT